LADTPSQAADAVAPNARLHLVSPERRPGRALADAVPDPLAVPDPDVHKATALNGSRADCAHCNLRPSCLPHGLTIPELEHIDGRLVMVRRKVAQGEALFRAGDRFDALFEIWTGFFKTVITTNQGREQVTGFQMGGELLGLDGIDAGRHDVDAIALESSQVCVIPYGELESLAREVPALQRQIHRLMSREIVNDHGVMLHLGSMHAEERVAAFLLNLTDRLFARGFSASALVLRMSREEIGSYLGLTLETVSRTFSKFQAAGLLFVRQRHVQITDPAGLRHLLDDVTV
jgi:CRP/FNR family transcriptional regulator